MQDFFSLLTKPIPRSAILGSGFRLFFQDLDKTQWYKPEELKRIKEKRLRALINHAYSNVSYYHRIFRERNLRPDDIKTVEDLTKIPILTKDDLRRNLGKLIAQNAGDYKPGTGRTSGSTGKPVTFLLDQQNREMTYAGQWRQRAWANVGLNSRISTLRGTLGWRKFERGRPYWKFNAFSKQLEFNILGIDKSILRMYVQELKKFRPELIEGYPSAIYLLAKYILEFDINGITPKAIQTSSETISESQRKTIEQAFCCRVYDWYGHSEYVVAAGQCPEGSYHIAESCIVEFVRDGEPVGEGEIGEIVGTGLYNYSLPFVRYETSDVGKPSDEICNCGRGLSVIQSLEGRISDTIVTPDGKLLSGMSFEHYWKNQIAPCTPNVEYVHVVQRSARKLLIEIVKNQHYSNEETQTILRELEHLMGSDIEIEFRELNSIPIGRKWRFTESEIKTNQS